MGDASFLGSAAPGQPLNVVTPPARVRGSVTATMRWTFASTHTYTTVLALVVNGALNDTLMVTCRGRGCGFAKRSALVTKRALRRS